MSTGNSHACLPFADALTFKAKLMITSAKSLLTRAAGCSKIITGLFRSAGSGAGKAPSIRFVLNPKGMMI